MAVNYDMHEELTKMSGKLTSMFDLRLNLVVLARRP